MRAHFTKHFEDCLCLSVIMTDAIYRELLANGSKVELVGGNVEFNGISVVSFANFRLGLLHPLKLDDVANLLKSAEKNPKISGITLSGQDLSANDASLFQNVISSGDIPLKSLDISSTISRLNVLLYLGNQFGPVGVTTLCHALKENVTLTKLSLNCISSCFSAHIKGTKFGEEGAIQVGNLIKLCDSLKILSISSVSPCLSCF